MTDTTHIADADITAAIEQHDDPDHPDALTVAEVRDVLAAIQTEHADYLQEFFDSDVLVHADEDMYVFANEGGRALDVALDQLDVDQATAEGEIVRSVVASVYQRTAERVTDYDWSAADAIVIGRGGPEAALSREEATLSDDAVVRSLVARGLPTAQALDYWLVEERGLPMTQVATERGTTHQAVSKNVRQAREKLARGDG